MSLVADYQRQFGWREWHTVFESLPALQGKSVLDLGCGVGDLAAEFAARGAHVIGVDSNEELICAAKTRVPEARFEIADLRSLPDLGIAFDGVWCSFTAAYFPADLSTLIPTWTRTLKPSGWLALVEIDNLFGHEPVSDSTRTLLDGYATESLQAGRYDFHMGRKLKGHMQRAGFTVSTLTVTDRELSFDGPADAAVIDAWRNRFQRMQLLREFCGPRIDAVEAEFLSCLSRADHRSLARVCCCIGTR
jgi:ubiquinone/menaquinone biosynthesis C-methylase UbiE